MAKENWKNWFFEHDEFTCSKCITGAEEHALNYYIGIHNGEHSHRYKCTNPKCDFDKVQSMTSLIAEAESRRG